ncbi:plasmid stabilization protein [Streptomyces sp. NPDC006733]|uniref:plasmid stabilization protein n=1 Tax=Streptomyces sp. NPDC006733 TaxID=3155460 RepID=UPI0033DEBA54
MPQTSSAKRVQRGQVKKSTPKRGPAKASTARTVRTATPKRAAKASTRTPARTAAAPAARRVSLRSRTGPSTRTFDQLYAEAQRRRIAGRSSMRKAELEKALAR